METRTYYILDEFRVWTQTKVTIPYIEGETRDDTEERAYDAAELAVPFEIERELVNSSIDEEWDD